ncbi:MAG: DUF86 domain-containing protein [Acidobacteria bacterium]|nr:DUF86 domain-containing protein [Acidobacteriota bacterium]
MSKDDAYVLDMLRAASLARQFAEGCTEARFLDDVKTQSAVLHQLTMLGEAVRRVSQEFREHHPQVPWGEIAGLRNRIVHEYDEIDLDRVWEVIRRDLPRLIPALEAIAHPEPS